MKKTLRFILTTVIFSWTCANADTMILTQTSEGPHSWTDISIWSNATTKVEANAYPSENDTIQWNQYEAKFSLDGNYRVGAFTQSFKSLTIYRDESTTEEVSLSFVKNLGGGAYQRYNVYEGTRLIVEENASLQGAVNDANPTLIHINKGGTMDVFGKVDSRHIKWYVYENATINYSPKSYTTSNRSSSHRDEYNVKGGTLNFSTGLNVTGGSLSQVYINHDSGIVNFGGPISTIPEFRYTWKGGTLAASADIIIPEKFDVNVGENVAATVDVAANKTLAIENIEFAAGASLVKTGAGKAIVPAATSTISEGVLEICASEVESVSFAGGTLELSANAYAAPKITAVSVSDGSKAKIKVKNLYLLPIGTYTLIAAGNTLTADDYDFDLDPSVLSTITVNGDGSVSLSITGVADNLPLYWRPSETPAQWDSDMAVWKFGDEIIKYADGSAVVFDGSETAYSGEISVAGPVRAISVTFEGEKDYVLIGKKIETININKKGSGTLAIDGEGFTGDTINISGGELQLRPHSHEYVKNGLKLNVADSSTVAVSSAVSDGDLRPKLFEFKYKSGSTSWEMQNDYTTELGAETLDGFSNMASPVAPDGVSLSGKSLYISGKFKVAEEDVGEWSFSGIYDDGIALWIDGEKLFQTSNYTDQKTVSVNLTDGWHTFEVRAYDGAGGWGNANCLRAKKPNSDNYLHFHEKNFNMDWRGTEADPGLPLSGIAIDVAVGKNSTFQFNSPGYVVRNLTLEEGAVLAFDANSIPAKTTFVSADDEETLAVLKEKLQISLGAIGTIVETDDGLAWEMEAVFSSDTVTDLMDKDGWLIGIVPGTKDDVVIEGSSTVGVMDDATTMFNSIALANGATLKIAAAREFPSTTLSAGSVIQVSPGQDAAGDDLPETVAVATGRFATTGTGTANADIDENCVLDLSGANLELEAKLVKTGKGSIMFGADLPENIEIAEGCLQLLPFYEYDLSKIAIAEGVTIRVLVNGKGTEAWPVVKENGKTVFMPIGTYIGTGTWNTLENWAGKRLPGADDVVHVLGEGTTLVIDDNATVMPAQIKVQDDAVLKVEASVTMPDVSLAPYTALKIGNNETKPQVTVVFNSVPNAEIAENGGDVQLPCFDVATNATLSFSFNTKLKNLNMTVCGRVNTTKANAGGIIFGHAAADETTYFALHADGATIFPLVDNGAIDCTAHFVWPDVGGRVIQLEPYHFVKCTFRCDSWAHYTNPRLGLNNPVDEPCEFIFDNTVFLYNYRMFAGGAAKLRCVNGGKIEPGWQTGHLDRNSSVISDMASIELDGKNSYLSAYGQGSKLAFNHSADTALEVPALTLKNGAQIKGFHLNGTGNSGLYVVSDGEWTIPRIYSPSSNIEKPETPLPVLGGFDAAVIAEDSIFRIVGRNEGACNTGKWFDWDRKLTVAGEFAGYGDVVVTNAVAGNSMEITITSGLNTCEGKISCSGENRCSLLFADGANWAGTVVAGNIGLTNLVAGGASSVSFGKLDLQESFPIRVWRGEDGELTSDRINVGEYLGTADVLPVLVNGEDDKFRGGDTITLGTIDADAELPSVKGAWSVKAQDVASDPSLKMLTLDYVCGTLLLIM